MRPAAKTAAKHAARLLVALGRWMERTAPDGDGDPTVEAYLEHRRQRRATWKRETRKAARHLAAAWKQGREAQLRRRAERWAQRGTAQ